MAQTRSIVDVRDDPLRQEGLCVLSLDGGGVRGLSTLLIIKALMAKVNAERKKDGEPPVKPCQLFDLIGGTSTGGIIAIMLGRLEMDIDDCITAYTNMFKIIFGSKSLPINRWGKIKGRFDSAVFEQCIGTILKEHGLSNAELFNDGKERCKVIVCTTAFESTSITLLRSYDSSEELNNIPVTICEAIRATSAASSFFDPVTIKPYGLQFVDGGLGANNPVEQLWNEAQNIWCQDEGEELSKILKCFVSIGTGNPGKKPLNEGCLKFFSETLVGITTETEKTAKLFIERHRRLYEGKQYFRFNVEQGLQGVGLQEYQATALIVNATVQYMDGLETRLAARECSINLKQKQFRREFSAQNIIKHHSKSVSAGPKPITFIPWNRNDSLVNRDGAFKAIDQLLTQPSQKQSIAIWGLGGCGKTQIALEYAYRLQRQTSCSIFWIHADSEARFTNDYSDLGKIAGIERDLKGEDLLRAVQLWMEHQTNWLLILDNADELGIFKKVAHSNPQSHPIPDPKLLRFIPRSQTGTVLWISRDKGILGSIVDVSRGIEVGAMTIEESGKLFKQLSGRGDVELSANEEKKLLELLELLERLPLAIAQAAAYIRKTKVSIAQYLEFFHESETRRSNLLSEEFQDVYRSEVPNSVMLTWLISMRRIAQESPCSEKLLNTIAFLDNQAIPLLVFGMVAETDFSDDEILIAAGRLMEFSFLQAQKADGDLRTYGQHRLVSLAVRQALSDAQTRFFSGEALRIMLFLFSRESYTNWSECQLYLPHALKAVEWEEGERYIDRAPSILYRIGKFYKEQGRSTEAEQINLKELKLQEKIFGKESYQSISAMSRLAWTWHEQGRFEEAERTQVKVLESIRKIFDDEHPETITAMANLATTWCSQGRFEEAEPVELKVLKLSEKILGKENHDTILAMSNLASTWQQQGKVVAAERLRSQVVDIRKKGLGERHPDTVLAMANLAASWSQQRRLDETEELQITVLNLQKGILGEKHPRTIMAMANLANTWSKQGRPDEAERLLTEVLELRREVLTPNHPNTIMTMACLAAIWQEQGRLNDAEKQQLEVLELLRVKLGEKHPHTITTRWNLANTLWRQDRITEADECLTVVLELQREVFGDKHPDSITYMSGLVPIRWKQGRFHEARLLQADVVRLRKEVLGEEHPDTTQAINALNSIDRGRDRSNREGKSRSISFTTLRTLNFLQLGAASKRSYNWRKTWGKKLMRWKKFENS